MNICAMIHKNVIHVYQGDRIFTIPFC